MNWHDLLPLRIAIAQIGWERRRDVRRMRTVGMTTAQIGARLGISISRAQQLATDRHSEPSPAQKWLETTFSWAYANRRSRRLTLADVARQH